MQARTRIVHVPRRFALSDWGGTEAVVTQLCLAQRAMGLHPEIHTSMALAPTAQEAWRGIPIHRYPHRYPFFGLSPNDILQLDRKGGNLLSLPLYRALSKLRDTRIFHAHVTKRMGGAVLRAARNARRPCVVTLHGNVFDVPPAEAADVTAPQRGHFEWGRVFGWFFRSRTLLQDADAVLCVGFSEFDKARQHLNPAKVHFLPNGVHPQHFQVPASERQRMRHQLGFADDAFVFGCISRIDPQKNQALLIDAFAQLHARFPNARLLLSGPVTRDDFAAKLQHQLRDLNLQQVAHLLPPVTPESPDHAALFAALDAFVLPSRHEPFGIVVLEAWAAGVPVIAAKVGGLARLVTPPDTGLHFPSGDAAALRDAMAFALSNPTWRATAIAKAKATVEASYTWHSVANQLEAVYRTVEANFP